MTDTTTADFTTVERFIGQHYQSESQAGDLHLTDPAALAHAALRRIHAVVTGSPVGDWARVSGGITLRLGSVVKLNHFSLSTGVFWVSTLDGKATGGIHSAHLERWLPKTDGTERVRILNCSISPNPLYGTVTAGPSSDLYTVKLEVGPFNCCSITLDNLEPAPPAEEPVTGAQGFQGATVSGTAPCGFKAGDPVRITQPDPALSGRVWRIQEVSVHSGIEWILLEGYRALIDPEILEHWKPVTEETVIHKKSGVRSRVTRVMHVAPRNQMLYHLDDLRGQWFDLDALGPVIESDLPSEPTMERFHFMCELTNLLRQARALLGADGICPEIDRLLAQAVKRGIVTP